ncbi:HAD hydrolase-like protein [Psychromonas arctica]|uniref:HAD hydrolase-like protein n=1 Tax=Psychromonas arctica TaxID=168275 RepID=A0ABU9HAI9_9GAMM
MDQWEVLHNGGDAFPEAIEVLTFLKSHNKKVVILSNSGKTGTLSYEHLGKQALHFTWDNAIAVGDSLEHDIAGANGANISSLFITSGIHTKAISDEKSIVNLCDEFSVKPSFYIDWFKA